TWLTIAAGLFALAARGWRGALPLLVVAGLADLGYYGLRSTWVYHYTDLVTFRAGETQPPGPPEGRVEIGDVYGNALMLLGRPLTSGYVGLSPTRVLDYSKPETQRLAGTVWRHDSREWHRIDGLPQVRLVAKAQSSLDPRVDLAAIDPAETALLPAAPDMPPG